MSVYDSILIPGGGGMLAHALVRALESRGHAAIALNRSALDVTDEAAVREAFRTRRPTLVVNCSAHTKVDLCEEEPDRADAINGHAVGLLARLAREHGALLVHYSTDFVFPGDGTRPYRPNDPTGPISAYGRSKLLGEEQLQASPPARWLILRTAWLYGRNGPCFPRTMVTAARAGKPLKVVSDQVGSPTFTDDLAAATLDLIDAGGQGIYHASNAGQTSWLDFTAAILEAFGLKTELSATTSAAWAAARAAKGQKTAHRPSYSVLDTSSLEEKIVRPMPHWREALRAYRGQVEAAGL